VVVSAPGLGDDIQAIKAGVLEIADIHVVSKCDRADANQTITELKHMLSSAATPARQSGWRLPVVATSAQQHQGVDELLQQIDVHYQFLTSTGKLRERQHQIAEQRLLRAAQGLLQDAFTKHRGGSGPELTKQLVSRDTHPHAAAKQLIDKVWQEMQR